MAEGARGDTERAVEALRAESAEQEQAEPIAALRARAKAADAELRGAASPVGEA